MRRGSQGQGVTKTLDSTRGVKEVKDETIGSVR